MKGVRPSVLEEVLKIVREGVWRNLDEGCAAFDKRPSEIDPDMMARIIAEDMRGKGILYKEVAEALPKIVADWRQARLSKEGE